MGSYNFDYVPYSLKLSRTKIFVDFVVFQAPTKILSLKISYKLAMELILCALRDGALNIQSTSEQRVPDNSS